MTLLTDVNRNESGDLFWVSLTEMIKDINGFVYSGDRLNAIIDTVKYLRANPAMVKVLTTKSDTAQYGDPCDPQTGYHNPNIHIGCFLR